MAERILPIQSSKVIRREPCPECRKAGNDTAGDNLAVYDDNHKYCYACTYFERDGVSNPEVNYTYEYLPYRGIYKETFEFYNTKTKVDDEGRPISIGFPYNSPEVFKVKSLIAPKGSPYHFKSIGEIAKAGLFGRNKFAAGSHKYVTITEGELDALSLYQTIRSPVVSVRSSSSAKLDCSIDRSWLNQFERIYIAFDADEPGRMAAADVAKLFDYNKVYDVRFPGGNRKDANDYIANGEVDELRNIWNNAKKYLPDNIISSRADLKKEFWKPVYKGIPYPWPTLNRMTNGLCPREVVLITAPTGVGKTEISHTLLHTLLKETQDNVGAIFLEESKQRLLQAVTGIQLKRHLHLPSSVRDPAEEERALDLLVPNDDRFHVYSHFGSDDGETILDTIRFLVSARGCRWIVFDLISLAVAGLGGDREEKALSYLSGRLALSTQELDYGLIMVSHENDFGQTRGSRMIANDCHVRIQAKRDVMAASDRLRRTTELFLSKNRPASQTGPAGKLLFDPVSFTLSEDFEADDNGEFNDLQRVA